MTCQRCKGKGVLAYRKDDTGLQVVERCPVCYSWSETGEWNHEQPRVPRRRKKIESLPLPGTENDPAWQKGKK